MDRMLALAWALNLSAHTACQVCLIRMMKVMLLAGLLVEYASKRLPIVAGQLGGCAGSARAIPGANAGDTLV
jgi:hypothetical protein